MLKEQNVDKKVYIVTNYDNEYSKAVAMSEEQARAINWFIDLADLNYSCQEPKDSNVEEI